jgi:hypothetical protein
MIAQRQTRVIVLQVTDELLAQLQPFVAGLDITTTAQRACAQQDVSAHGQFAQDAKIEPGTQQLTMRGDVYDVLTARVHGALDYDIRWRPNEYEPEGFVERVQPLQLTDGTHAQAPYPQCGAHVLANRVQVRCACGQAISLL